MPYYYFRCDSCNTEISKLVWMSERDNKFKCDNCETGLMSRIFLPESEDLRDEYNVGFSGTQESVSTNNKRKKFVENTLQRIHDRTPGSILNKTTEGIK